MLIMPPMSDDHHYRQREYDYYHDRRASDHYHDRCERDHYRRKRERERGTLADASAVVYNPLAAALRVAVLVAALWLVVTVLSMAEAIAYDWWRSVFVIAAVITLLGLGREILLCLIRSFREKRFALSPLISGALVGIIAAGVLHFAGVMAAAASALANAPPV